MKIWESNYVVLLTTLGLVTCVGVASSLGVEAVPLDRTDRERPSVEQVERLLEARRDMDAEAAARELLREVEATEPADPLEVARALDLLVQGLLPTVQGADRTS